MARTWTARPLAAGEEADMKKIRSQHPEGSRDEAADHGRVQRTGKMHENVPVWSDPCCSCEAEPYWREVAEEMGIDLDAGED